MIPKFFHQRADVLLVVTVYQDANHTSVQDVTGASNLVGRLGLAKGGVTSVELDGAIVDAPNGVISYSLPSAKSSLLAPGQYDFQGEMSLDGNLGVVVDEKIICKASLPDIP